MFTNRITLYRVSRLQMFMAISPPCMYVGGTKDIPKVHFSIGLSALDVGMGLRLAAWGSIARFDGGEDFANRCGREGTGKVIPTLKEDGESCSWNHIRTLGSASEMHHLCTCRID